MTFAFTTTTPLYLGSPTSPLVPSLWNCALAGRTYMLETPGETALFPPGSNRVESVPLTRQQSDTGDRPGESSLNPESAWRRTVDSWHKGAGQEHYDRLDSNPFRFNESKGVDPWSDWSLSLLPDVINVAGTETNYKALVVNDRIYFTGGDVLLYLTDIDPVTGDVIAFTGGPADWVDITTDGSDVYVTDGSNVWKVAWDGTDAGAAWSTLDCDVIAFVNGRLMAAHDDEIFYFAADGTLGASVTIGATLPSDWQWVGFTEGPQAIYASGYAGDRTIVFRIPIKDDGTGLDAAVPAVTLPDGEQVFAIGSYLGFVLIGTDRGVRFATPDSTGNLTAGALLETGSPCRCFEGQGSFVWFGWDDFDAVSTGLGRLDLREFADVEALAPAYASDLMGTAQGEVTSVATYDGLRLFTVSGEGVFVQHPTDLVESGWVTSGEINFGLVEEKEPLDIQVLVEQYAGGIGVELSTDVGVNWTSLGQQDVDTPFNAQGNRARRFDVRLTLERDATDETLGPLVSSWTLQANPSVSVSRLVWAALVLHKRVEGANEREQAVDVALELETIQALNESRQVVVYQQGSRTRSVTVEDHEFRLWNFAKDGSEQGTVLVKMKQL